MAEESLLQKFESYLRKNRFKLTTQRRTVARTFFLQKGHITAEDLYRRVQKKYPDIGFTTVYRTLNLLVKAGLASDHNFKSASSRFESSGGNEHHDHLICTECGRIIEFKNVNIEKLQQEVAGQHGFTMTEHTLEIFGICERCRKK